MAQDCAARMDHMTWTLLTLTDEAGLSADVRGDAGIGGIAYDSRSVRPGDLFCCIPGAALDGHAFAGDAARAGAAALLVERWSDVDVAQARVERVRAAMGPLAHVVFSRPSEAMDVAALTGTNGKTTTTYLIEAMATAAGRTAGVIGNVERRLGGRSWPSALNTPESVDLHRLLAEMRDAGGEVIAMEVTSEGIDQGRIDATRFACAAFTNLSQDHLNYHGTLENYFEAKARLFTGGFTSRAVVNTNDAWGRRLLEMCAGGDVLTYAGEGADLRVESSNMSATGTDAVLHTPVGPLEVRTPLVGHYNLENLLCAAGVGLHLGLEPDAIAAGAGNVRLDFGRLEPVEAGQPFTVLVDYAHTPDALERVLEAARDLTSRRLIVVFGCGGDRDRAKRPLMGRAATSRADLTVVTSDNPRSEDPAAIIAEIVPGAAQGGGSYVVEPDRRAAIAAALEAARPGDVVVVAGKGHEQGQTFADRTVPFDDRVVARELLEGGIGCRA
jgi:UDP-N-acetylmuramoyl-L-alanyl-D-glutamate--2,6-diaminopimelate ligase